MKRKWIYFLCINCPLLIFGQAKIEKVEITGNIRIPRETILYYFDCPEGASFDTESLEKGMKALWSTGFFADIEVAERQGKEGRVLILTVEEYPVVKELVFDKGEEIKEREILEVLQEKNLDLSRYSVYDPQKILQIITTLEGILADKGFNQGTVTSEIHGIGNSEAEVVIHIREGPRFRIGEIVFEGKPKLKKSILLGAFKSNQEHNLFSWIKGTDIFREARLNDDLDNLRQTLGAHGYAAARVGEPRIEEVLKRRVFGGPQSMKRIIIPVDAGDIYEVGKIRMQNSGLVSTQQISQQIHLEEGDRYDEYRINQLAKKIESLYQDKGYFNARVLSEEHMDPKSRKVDLTFNIQEGAEVFLGRLNFSGNTITNDGVLRGIVLIPEKEKFRLDLFSKSIEKLLRLGIVKIEDRPDIAPDPDVPSQIDVQLKVVEVHENQWQLGGGYSGYQGVYLGGSVSAVDCLGAGEIFDLSLEYGDRSKVYEMGFSKPYLFDDLVSVSFRLFYQDILYPELFVRKGKGLQGGVEAQIKGYWWGALNYRFEGINAAPSGMEAVDSTVGQNLGAATVYLYRDTVDDLFFPTEGARCLLSFGYAGSELGSDIQYIKPELEGALFFPLAENHTLGFHLAYRSIIPVNDSEIPYWEKFYLGGERTLRGYDVYSIGPQDEDGRNIGGEKSLVVNAEYIIPVFDSLASVLFCDAGNAFRRSQDVALDGLYWSSGVEIRMKIFDFQIPFRFIFAFNNRLLRAGDSHFAFRVAFGASF